MSFLESLRNVAVVGAGTMGNGIAQVFATGGYTVTLIDPFETALTRAKVGIEKSLEKLVQKGKLTLEQTTAALARLHFAPTLDSAVDAQLAIEAVPEQRTLKLDIHHQLDELLAPAAIIASNTSSISITSLATATGRPAQFIGMHFMNPVPLMKLIEVIRGHSTSDATAKAIREVALALGKTPVESTDYPGFVSNRVLMPMLNEAMFCVMEGVATPQAIDDVMKLGMNHPMGPLTLADFIGLDVCLHILEVLHTGLGDPKYRACPLLRRMVAAGHLGRKSGRGFFEYSAVRA
ncbi:MAG: 3-hydroxyacyl-CoA dehydrogenase NAD-binding domain-containing protein [Planctomycetota bacterium]